MSSNKSANSNFISEEEAKKAKTTKNAKPAKKKSDKPNFFKRIGMKIKDVFSELKKVNWQSFPKVVKQTGVVLVVVVAFLVVISAFDFGLLQLLNLVAPRG